MTFLVHDRVRHADRPNEIGEITRIAIGRDGQLWIRVNWPSGVGSGALYLSRVLTHA